MNRSPLKHLRAQGGFLIADYIFSISIAAFMGVLLFSISYSLVAVEITQYVSYATARAHAAGNKNPEEQKAKARRKYASLTTGKSAIGSLYQTGWFEAARPAAVDIRGGPSSDGQTFGATLAGGSDKSDRNWFIGVSIPLTIKLMSFNFPFLGETTPDHPKGLQTNVNSMLIRDPSESECQTFIQQRRTQLGTLPSGQQFYDQSAYVPMEDNGC